MGRVLVQQPGTNTAKALTETLPKNVIIVDEDLKELRLHDGVTPGGKIIGQSAGSGVPIGTIIPFAGNSVPQGYLLCDGSAISRTDYASLFAVIGTIYGAGDGNSTFNLPDLKDRTILGVWDNDPTHIGMFSDGQLPNIYGTFGIFGQWQTMLNEYSGAFTYKRLSAKSGSAGNYDQISVGVFDAYTYNQAYMRHDSKALPSHIKCYFIIKYI